jgi:hypothetical protein
MNAPQIMASVVVAVSIIATGCSRRPAHSAWASSASFVIEPGVSIGPLHSDMTIQQVIEELGQPDKTNDKELFYSHLGLQVAHTRGGDVMYRVTIEHPFAGRTKDGIGIGSGRAEVIQSFGEPKLDKHSPTGFELLIYKQSSKSSLEFKLQDGRVDMMSVFFFLPAKMPPNTALEPTPTAP